MCLCSAPWTRLVGSQELTRLLGVGRARVYQISSADDFPKPAAVLAMGSIWRLEDIKEWAARKGRTLHLDRPHPRRRPGRRPGRSRGAKGALVSVVCCRRGGLCELALTRSMRSRS